MTKSVITLCFAMSLLGFGCGEGADDLGALAQELEEAASGPNLKNEGITHTDYCNSSNQCSVQFYNNICNRGNASSGSSGFSVAMKGWGSATISTCTGLWQATNTTTNLSAGTCRSVLVYGPGYVGSKVTKGTYLTVTGYADARCNNAETNESDNSLSTTIRVGY